MEEPTLILASPRSNYHAFLPISLMGGFLRELSEHLRIKVWFAFVAAYANFLGTNSSVDHVLGSFLSLKRYPERTLHRWAKYYGPIYSVWLGNQLFVIVSEPGIAKGLMATHGAVFSDRKEMFIKSQTVLVGRGITASPYSKRWRKHRRIASLWLSRKAVESYTHVLDFEATDMISHLHRDCGNGMADVNPQVYADQCSLNNMLTITFSFRTDSAHHPMVALALRLSREFMNITGPVSNLVDFVPILQRLPSSMRCRARTLHSELVNVYGGLIKEIAEKMQAGGEVQDCLVKTMLLRKEKEALDELDVTMLASAFIIGGIETTASVMQWFTALIPAHPHVQTRAQEELDRVVGRDRLPTVEDEANLPYCSAIVKEVERCHNPFWLGTPHMANRDSVYGEHLIPKGTVVVLNTWTMHHDPERWGSPMEFAPDRYANEQLHSSASAKLPNPKERDHWIFAAGRRICPGMLVAEREIRLTVSRMLWAFDTHPIAGKPIDLNEYDGESGRSPMPFEVRLRPRFPGVRKILEEESERWRIGSTSHC
ncbi:hypothetical protein PMIN01_13335 [Paraphaeosphaeria minitans]|uniref:Cytochrome P450 n=1 Tax=Paraphaeosphaeria minitans TaxID=565426 RepID=A0A9P6G3P7_9PLEO|nr:hypothetical protein PMIN01_13335 [Paraphaeosphaeria minitans]